MKSLFEEVHFLSEGWLFAAPCIMIAIDFITGILNAWSKKILSSKKLRSGLTKKVGEIIIIIIAEILTYALGFPHYVVSGISGYIIFMEIVSVLENLSKMGVPIPQKIKDVLNNNPEDLYLDTLDQIEEDHKNEV